MLAPISNSSSAAQPGNRLQRVLRKLDDRGITIELTERHTIRAIPAERLDDDLRYAIRQHRDLLIEHLMAQRLANASAVETTSAASVGTAADEQHHHGLPTVQTILSGSGSSQSVFVGTHARVAVVGGVGGVDGSQGHEEAQSGGNGLPTASVRSLMLVRPQALNGQLIYVASDDAVGVGFQYLAPNNPMRPTYPVYFQSELPLIRELGDEGFAAFHPQRVALLTLWEPWVSLTDWELVALGKQAGLGRYATMHVVEHLGRAGLTTEWIVWNTLRTTLRRPQHGLHGLHGLQGLGRR